MTNSVSSVLLLTKIPDDLRAALGGVYRLVELDGSSADIAGCSVGVTTAMHGLAKETLQQYSSLKLILSQGVGLDRLDLPAAAELGVDVSVTPNILTEDVADFAIGLTYAIARSVAAADRFVRAGNWKTKRIAPSISLHNKKIGIVGMGRIGQAIAKRAAGLGMSVCYTSRAKKSELAYAFCPEINALAREVDVLVLACAGGEETKGICDSGVLKSLGRDGLLINISRGSVVEEGALLDALENGELAGAGLDVFASEPEIDERFYALENVVLTPHSASVTREVRQKLIACMLEEADAHFGGRTLKYTV